MLLKLQNRSRHPLFAISAWLCCCSLLLWPTAASSLEERFDLSRGGVVDLTIVKSNDVGGAIHLSSGSFKWSLQIVSNGSGDATFSSGDIILRDELPNTGVTYGGWELVDQQFIQGTGQIDCDLTNAKLLCRAAGGTVTVLSALGTFTVEVEATPTMIGTLTNPPSGGECLVDPDGELAGEISFNNDCNSDSVVVDDSPPDLTITKTNNVGGTTDLEDGAFTWSLLVENQGGGPAIFPTGYQVVFDSLPDSGLTYAVSISNPNGLTGSLPCSVITFDLYCVSGGSALASGGSFSVDIVATPTEGGTFANPRPGGSCSVDSNDLIDESDPGGEANNDCETNTVVVVGPADLALSKSDSDDPVVGSTFFYTLQVENLGPEEATNVVITDTLPSGISFLSSADGCTNNGDTVTCAISSIANGATAGRTFTVEVDAGIDSQLTNTATVTADQTDPNTDNNTASETTQVDTLPPQVLQLSVGGVVVTECGTAQGGASQIQVDFDEMMANPPGDDGMFDVTNPANYQVLTPGDDLTFQTEACGAVGGDDEQLSLTSVVYEGDGPDATLNLAEPLGDGLHRLYVCSELEDSAQNSLDGDGDGTGGDDAEFRWRVEDALIENGNFDCSLDGWTATSTNPNEISWASIDVEGSGSSGSAGIGNLTASTEFSLEQCVGGLSATEWELRSSLNMISCAPGEDIDLQMSCDFHDTNDCSGTPLVTISETFDTTPGGGVVDTFTADLTAPVGTWAGRCELKVIANQQEDFFLILDAVSLREKPFFEDGFETGNTSAWSTTTP